MEHRKDKSENNDRKRDDLFNLSNQSISYGGETMKQAYWDFGGAEKECLIHRIHSYPAKFPSFITTKALKYAKKEGVKVKTVADVFCGCGTTAVEAKRKRIEFWGFDINPVAVMISQVKTKRYKEDVLKKHFSKIVKRFDSVEINEQDTENINDRIKYWFNAKNIKDLLKLKKAIEEEISNYSKYKKFFLCAFSNILKSTSNWLTKSIKPQIDPDKLPSDVMKEFKKQFEFMEKANGENIPKQDTPPIRIIRRNFLSINTNKHKADLIVTSPPYVTSYDYADIHQLSALWLDFCSKYQDLRKNMVGNIYGVASPSDEELKSLPSVGMQIYKELRDKHKAKANSTARYFIDIRKAAENCYEVLNKNGMVVFVIGNTNYKGVEVDNAQFLRNCMESVGFQKIKNFSRKISSKTLTPYRDAAGRFTRDKNQRKVYSEEFILIGRRM